jgi:CRISPR-associated endonuclease Cas1
MDSSPFVSHYAAPVSASDGNDWRTRCAQWIGEVDRAAPKRRRRERRAEPLILTGHGLSIRVAKGALLVRDGHTHWPQEKREHRFFKGALDAPTRVVVVDGSGEITLDALDWMSAQGVALIRLAWNGEARAVLSPTGYAADPERVAWQRATRGDPAARLEFSTKLVADKLEASLATLRDHVPASKRRDAATAEAERTQSLIADNPPTTVSDLLGHEGRAAKAYFAAWAGIPVAWRGAKSRPVPDAWRRFESRASLARGMKPKNRFASHPVNAMLNYAYGALETRLRIEAVADGYDPTLGIMHNPWRGRSSYVFDLMEPERPRVDAAVLRFVRETVFNGADFTLRDDGVCRLNPELARRVVQLVDGAVPQKSPQVASTKPRVVRKPAARKVA